MGPFEEEKELRHMSSGRGSIGWCSRTRWHSVLATDARRGSWWLARAVGVLAGVLLLAAAPALAAAAEVKEEFVSNVSASSATLDACVNPESSEPVSYRFEYGPSVPYGMSVAAAAVGVGTCVSGVSVQAHVQGLKAKTAYDYRVLVSVQGQAPHAGSGESFTTQPAGGELTLPDDRQWEPVSPAKKDGALIAPIETGAGIIQAAEGGGAITYPSNGPPEAGPASNANETQVLSVRRAGGGWSSQDIATPHAMVTGVPVQKGQEYRAFSLDLSLGLAQPFGLGFLTEEAEGAVPLSEGASEATPYLRADTPLPAEPGSSEQAAYSDAEMEGGYLPLVAGCPPAGEECKPKVEERANARPGAKFGGHLVFLGANPDLSDVILRSEEVALVAGAEAELYGLYEWAADKPPAEQLQLVSVLPDAPPYNGEQARSAALGNINIYDARGAVSSDGSRIVWSYEGHLFMRYVLSGNAWQTVQLDVGSGSGPGRTEFQFANGDGSKIFFTDEERLTGNSKAEAQKPELYECEMSEVAGGLKCDLSDLTVAGGVSESADVQQVVLAGSSSSSYLYLVAEGVLTSEAEKNGQGEKAEAGKDNLYMLHYDEATKEWKPTFIAALSENDGHDWDGPEGNGNLEELTSGVSPNGEYLVFMSERSLTGYDNVDINGGVPDEEVYLYGAPSAGAPSGGLVCVSCNPTGEQPTGVLDTEEANGGRGLLADRQHNWVRSGGRWLAGIIPGWTGMEFQVARYQSRYVLDDGRVFFDSPDALVPQATNGLMDVYEYELAGTVNSEGVSVCNEGTAAYSATNGGCTSLISSGSSKEESVFLDASANGSDVFFLTSAPLVGKDQDTAFDIYDAHECSASAACGVEAEAPPACDTEASCKPSPTPQPTIFGAGPSETFVGAGNPVGGRESNPPVVKPVVKPKSVKCKRGFVKNKKSKCVRRKKAKAKKSAHTNRGARS